MKELKLRKDLKIALLAWQGETEKFRAETNFRRILLLKANKKLEKLKEQERIHHDFFALLKKEVGKEKYDELCKIARKGRGAE